ncbi:MAG: hypothetical protein NT120_03960, partial [Candidatus Aenigmarchaeota archaeon]|nr:hypothetical protein [Candidatus Aenigmarchaeota archaeon]
KNLEKIGFFSFFGAILFFFRIPFLLDILPPNYAATTKQLRFDCRHLPNVIFHWDDIYTFFIL